MGLDQHLPITTACKSAGSENFIKLKFENLLDAKRKRSFKARDGAVSP
jgi:hypothetical protein